MSDDVSRLAYVLLSRGLITPKDVNYIDGTFAESDWMEYNKEYRDHICQRFIYKHMKEE